MTQQSLDSARSEIRELIKAAKYPQACLAATELLEKHGQDAELLYLRGKASAHNALVAEAEKDLRAAIALRPRCIDYQLALSNILYSNGKYEAALNAYFRATCLSPKHPKVMTYGEILAGPDGKLQQTLQKLENQHQQDLFNRKLTDQLASLYFVTAVFHWHVYNHNNQLSFYATNIEQIEEAEYYLKKLKSLRPLREQTQQNRNKLHAVIKASRQRQFDAYISDWVLAGTMLSIGIAANGFFDNWYAISAAATIWAFLKPSYLFNRPVQQYSTTPKDRFDHLMDVCYGEYIQPSLKLLRGIKHQEHRAIIAKVLRSLLRASLMPIAVFAGFYKNYSIRHAAVFLAGSLLFAWLI